MREWPRRLDWAIGDRATAAGDWELEHAGRCAGGRRSRCCTAPGQRRAVQELQHGGGQGRDGRRPLPRTTCGNGDGARAFASARSGLVRRGLLRRPGCGSGGLYVDLGTTTATLISAGDGTGRGGLPFLDAPAAADAPERLAHAADGRQADGAHHGELQQPRPPWNEASGRTPIQNPVGRSSSTVEEEHWG